MVIALGTGASEYYKTLRQPKKMDERIQEYEQAWKTALEQVASTPPPGMDEYIKKAPLGHHGTLRQKFTELDGKYLADYEKAATKLFEELEVKFQGKWED